MKNKKIDQKNKIILFFKENRRMPGYKEIMDLLGFKSKNSVHKLINWLVEEGIVSKDLQGRITPSKMIGEIPLLGLVEAGIPSVVEGQEFDTISIEEFLIEDKNKSYLLEVKGDSMIEAHIEEGDYVLVERKSEPRVGDIVIAEIDGGWTMKYFKKDKKGIPYLEPANKNYDNIYPEDSFRVAAVVKAVIRKY